LLKPEGTGRIGKPKLQWLELVEKDVKNMGVRDWGRKSEEWRTILEEAKKKKERKKSQGDKITTEFLEGCPLGMHSQLVPYFRMDLRLF
jgi:hypothetical protein